MPTGVKPRVSGICNECLRLHGDGEPCPRRVASAYTMQPKALEQLTEADKKWMVVNQVSVLDILEEELANRM